MSPSPTRPSGVVRSGPRRRRRAAALVPAAALLVAGLGVAGAPAFAEDAGPPPADVVIEASIGDEESQTTEVAVGPAGEAPDGTVIAGFHDNAYTREIEVYEDEDFKIYFTNGDPNSATPLSFRGGEYRLFDFERGWALKRGSRPCANMGVV